MSDKIELSKDKQALLISEIKTFFLKERDEELGDLASGLILEFFMEKLAPEIYNQGVYDAYQYMKNKLEDVPEIQKY